MAPIDLTSTGSGVDVGVLQALWEDFPDGVLVIDDYEQVQFANRAALVLFNTSADKLLAGICPLRCEHDGDYPIPTEPERVLSVRIAPTQIEGRPMRLLALRDVSAQHRLERDRHELMLADRRSAMVQVARTVAHEIRNPAAVILTNLATMRDNCRDLSQAFTPRDDSSQNRTSRPPPAHLHTSLTALRDLAMSNVGRLSLKRRRTIQEQLDSASEALAWLSEVVTELDEMIDDGLIGVDRMRSFLEEFRAMVGTRRRAHQEIDLHEIADYACEICAPLVQTPIVLMRNLPPVPTVVGDRFGLIQALVSLLTNACAAVVAAHGDRGSQDDRGEDTLIGPPTRTLGRIRVTTSVVDEHIHVTVSDNGVGISDEHLERLFDPLYLPDPDDSRLGVGLVIAEEIIADHRGEIKCHSEVGIGTRFDIVLPLDTGLSVDSGPVEAPGPLRSRILLIDDDDAGIERLTAVLAPEYELVPAASGVDALDLVKQSNDYDVVICELTMAAMDGLEFYSRLAREAPRMLPRLLFVGAGEAVVELLNFVSADDIRVLRTPIDPATLRAQVASICD